MDSSGSSKEVVVVMDWKDALPAADKVTWEFWSNSNDMCGPVCDVQKEFIKVGCSDGLAYGVSSEDTGTQISKFCWRENKIPAEVCTCLCAQVQTLLSKPALLCTHKSNTAGGCLGCPIAMVKELRNCASFARQVRALCSMLMFIVYIGMEVLQLCMAGVY